MLRFGAKSTEKRNQLGKSPQNRFETGLFVLLDFEICFYLGVDVWGRCCVSCWGSVVR